MKEAGEQHDNHTVWYWHWWLLTEFWEKSFKIVHLEDYRRQFGQEDWSQSLELLYNILNTQEEFRL